MDKISIVLLVIIFIGGCVQLRDYTGTKEGAFGLDVQNRFGEGQEKKDYYVVSGGDGIVLGDTKREVTALLGSPNQISSTTEGYERWVYEERRLELLFSEDKLHEWKQF